MILKIEFERPGKRQTLEAQLSQEELNSFKDHDVTALLNDFLGHYQAEQAEITHVALKDAVLTVTVNCS
jgi:hypothetical protein